MMKKYNDTKKGEHASKLHEITNESRIDLQFVYLITNDEWTF